MCNILEECGLLEGGKKGEKLREDTEENNWI